MILYKGLPNSAECGKIKMEVIILIDKYTISTANHIRFDPTTPEPANICIEDIAHALSMLTRANGHFTEFYSVARHSVKCAQEAKLRGYTKKVQLLCLLHDSAEAYIGDMTRPLKLRFPLFSAYEKTLQRIIFEKLATLDISPEEAEQVRSVDDSLLYHEFFYYHGDKLFDTAPEIYVDVRENKRNIAETKSEFLSLYNALKLR